MSGRDGGSQPIHLHLVKHECRNRWHHLHDHPWDQTYISVGVLGDGRWYVDVTGQVHEPVRTFSTEQEARAVAQDLMDGRGGEWERLPCHPTRSGAGAGLSDW